MIDLHLTIVQVRVESVLTLEIEHSINCYRPMLEDCLLRLKLELVNGQTKHWDS